jgi:hypothetical protein
MNNFKGLVKKGGLIGALSLVASESFAQTAPDFTKLAVDTSTITTQQMTIGVQLIAIALVSLGVFTVIRMVRR